MVRHESVVREVMVLIKVVRIAGGAGLLIVDAGLIEVRLIQFEEGCCGDGHATGFRTIIFTISVFTSSSPRTGRRNALL